MKALSCLIFLFFLSLNVFGADIQAELHLISPPSVIKEGDLVEGLLKVWPLENADQDEFKKLENVTLANSLVVTEVESVGVSANNADVVEVKLLFIAKNSKEKSPSLLSYKNQLIPIQIPSLTIESTGEIPKDYYVLDQGIISSYLGIIIASLLFLILLIVAVWKRQGIKNIFKKFKIDPIAIAKKKNHEMFLRASNRRDYEEIYAARKEWLALVAVQAPAYNEFFKIMEQHQYKKDWNGEELIEVKNSFDVIRGSFK